MFNRRITAATAGVLVAIGLGGGLVACSSGPSTPPNATQILQSDGYTPSAAYTTAMQGGIATAGSQADQITSSEAGTNGGNIQGVLVFDNSSDAATAAAQDPSAGGITVAQNGDVVTLTGSVSSFASLAGS